MSTLLLLFDSFPLLLAGALVTVKLWALSACIALLVGSCWGIFRSNRLWMPGISNIFQLVCFVLKGTPFYVQLLIAYFVLPELVKINISAFTASTISLGLCSAAYVSQIIKSGFDAIPNEQWEAAFVLGYSPWQKVTKIMIPQTLRMIKPALVAEMDQLLKSTSIISSIGVFELTRAGKNIVEREMAPIPIYLFIAAFYLCMSCVLNFIASKLIKQKGT